MTVKTHNGSCGFTDVPMKRDGVAPLARRSAQPSSTDVWECVVAAFDRTCAVGHQANHSGWSRLFRLVAGVCRRLGLQWFEHTLIFLKLDLKGVAGEPDLSYSFHLVTADEVQSDHEYCDGWFPRTEAVRRLHHGHRLFVLRQNDQNVCFEWSELGDVHIRWLDLRFCLPPEVAYGTGLYTKPGWRGQGFAARLAREVSRYWKARGLKHYLVVVDPQNNASLSMQLRRGFVPYQTVCYRRRLWLRCYSVHRSGSPQRKKWFTVFGSPREVWRTFWCGGMLLAWLAA